MTNIEAIKIAQGLITDFKCESETMVEFCNIVIKALSAEPQGFEEYLKQYLGENNQMISARMCMKN